MTSEDYTPSTDEAREAYAYGAAPLPPFYAATHPIAKKVHQEQFDRWLACVKAGAIREAAVKFAEGAWSDAFDKGRVCDATSSLQARTAWLMAEADRIEAGA